jgi:superfamily II RNA helicase
LRRCGINKNFIILAALIKENPEISAAFETMSKRRVPRDRKKPSRSRSAPPNERRNKRRLAGESSREFTEPPQTLDQLKAVERLLSGIGVPKPSPFKPDDFQLEALAAIEKEDVLVTAPTGSGKTWIAREEIRRLLESGRRAWYTTPLKALTNSKYVEFSDEFGAENVGILTGDRKENIHAPLIVGTTEIYRNQIFDAMRGGTQLNTDFVIFDEAHYIADEERGHVWEEAIILTPPRIRLLLLSATVGRAREFADWIGEVRGTRVRVIDRAGTRPVELRAAYLSQGLQLYPLFGPDGSFNRELDRFAKQQRRQSGRRFR